jgi:hypothetical protein
MLRKTNDTLKAANIRIIDELSRVSFLYRCIENYQTDRSFSKPQVGRNVLTVII